MRVDEPAPPDPAPLDRGLMHLRAAEPDHAQAVYWLRIAAEGGDTEALALLAWCQLEGLGLPRAPALARAGLEQAAAQGSLTAQFHLGRTLLGGWGGAPDPARGFALYAGAALRGHADATFNLAACLDAGWGCQLDRLAAKALFLRARALGCRLRAPGLRIRQRELPAVRELARRLALEGALPHVIEERQREIALMQQLSQITRHRPRGHGARTGSSAAFLARLADALAGLFGWRGRGGVPHDAGPTSIA
ncbi:tetratricopeptide repeat protein [Roseateles sp. DC23W]|uniref:Tetratricopeptide repeat protein n=1 Tax=Pelomonas dachongensis TaxID=3299029 RepID=A0ABW7EPZ5_9BURK